MKLSNLVNIGPKLEELLISSGVENVEKLQELGAAKAAHQVYQKHPESAVRLAALEGAIRGTRWHNISQEEREKLESEFDELCSR